MKVSNVKDEFSYFVPIFFDTYYFLDDERSWNQLSNVQIL
jgi:hypothetical protein